VSDDDVRKRLLEKLGLPFELAPKGVFRLRRCYIFRRRCYIFWQGVPGLWASNRESTATDGRSLRQMAPEELSHRPAESGRPLPGIASAAPSNLFPPSPNI